MAGRWLASFTIMYAASRALPSRLSIAPPLAAAAASASSSAAFFLPRSVARRRRRIPSHHPESSLLGRHHLHQSHPYATSASVTRRASSTYDDQGRRIRNRSFDDDGKVDDESWRASSRNENKKEKDRWGDYSDGEEETSETSWTSFRTTSRRGSSFNDDRRTDDGRGRERFSRAGGSGSGSRSSTGVGRDRGGRDNWRSGSGYGGPRFGRERPGRPQSLDQQDSRVERKINMNALEGAGFVHLYGLAPVLNALQANRRDMSDPDDLAGKFDAFDADDDGDEGGEPRKLVDKRKPEAQFRPWLFVQEKSRSGRGSDKALQEQAILKLAEERNVPVATVDKGVLNALSGNRPHQGVCLRCGRLDFTTISRIPTPDEASGSSPRLWLVLDEVVDPQNFGALLRSAYFLGGTSHVRVLVCGKNSAPPSPIVSAASAGALEIVPVFSTNNLPRTLAAAEEDGFAILGASSQVRDLDTPVYDLQDLPLDFVDRQPTILVLGSEGSGLRHLVAKSCTHFVRIPSGGQPGSDDSSTAIAGVDSLNVSVTGGILLWRLLAGSSAGR